METVYIETTIVSYLVAQPSRNPVTGWRQKLTQEWWTAQRGQFACMVSQEVITESLEGDSVMAAKRIAALKDMPLISGGSESIALAMDLLQHGLFPANAPVHPKHLEVAALAAVACLLISDSRQLAKPK